MSSPQSDDDDVEDVEFVSVRHICTSVTLKVNRSKNTQYVVSCLPFALAVGGPHQTRTGVH